MANKAYIKTLKDNELLGGTDNKDVYPVTTTQAVYSQDASGKVLAGVKRKLEDRLVDIEQGTYRKNETYTKAQVDELVQTMNQFSFVLVDALPTYFTEDDLGKIYLTPSNNNTKDEWIVIKNELGVFEPVQIGNTDIDLTKYPTTEAMNRAIVSALDTALIRALLNYYNKAQVDALIAKAGSGEINNNTTVIRGESPYNTLKEQPDAYIRNVHYDVSKTTGSLIGNYTNNSVRAARADQPLPIEIQEEGDTLEVYPQWKRGAGNLTYDSYNGTFTIYNLIPGRRYFYAIDGGDRKSFEVKSTRRFIYATTIKNVRDLGGIPTEDGGMLAYDKIFRGSEIEGKVINVHYTDPFGIKHLNNLGISLDLDLRRSDELGRYTNSSPLNAYYTRIPFLNFNDIVDITTAKKNKIKQAFEAVANEVLTGGKVYIHCAWGFHRAGLLCTLIEGVLGVKQCEIDKDYELSSFADFNEQVYRDDDNYKNGIETINSKYGGSWDRFLRSCGVSQVLINSFKNAMVVDLNKQSEINSKYYEVTYKELVELRDNGYLVPGAKYRMIDYVTESYYDAAESACSGITDIPEYKSSGHPFDLVLTALSNKELDCNVKAVHTERDTEEFFKDVDLAKWDLKYDLDNNTDKYAWAVNVNAKVGTEEVAVPIGGFRPYSEDTPNYGGEYFYRTYIGTDELVIKHDGVSPRYGIVESFSNTYSFAAFHPGDKIYISVISNGYRIEKINMELEVLAQFNVTTLQNFYRRDVYQNLQGKGVIYYMRDEFNNELPYDFKNILFKIANTWYPTFTKASNVVMKPWIEEGAQRLNCNVFTANSIETEGQQFIDNCFFDNNAHSNRIIGNAINLKVGKYCQENRIFNADNCVIGDDCVDNLISKADNVYMGNSCVKLIISKSGGNKYLLIDDYLQDMTVSALSEFSHAVNSSIVERPYRDIIRDYDFNNIIGG